LADELSLAAVALSAITLVFMLYLLMVMRRRSAGVEPEGSNLEATISEVKGSVSGLQAAVTQLNSTVGEIKQATTQTSSGMVEMMKFAELLSGSSQKRGQAGEIMVQQYLEKLPREMWEKQFFIPGSNGRVDYALRIYNGSTQLFLPIDAKFSLPDSAENFADESNSLARKRATEIIQYIVPGVTTDFAVMVLPNSVFYALTAETVGSIEDLKIVPCPPEGIIILSTLAMRAHQTVVLARSAEKLRDYVGEIDGKIGKVRDDIEKWAKHLRGASKYAKQTLDDLDDTRASLGSISTRLTETPEIAVTAPQLSTPTEIAFEEPSDEATDET
jgi:DNA anti-recombination protein RmuC